jgi:STE24 endopeptidase
MPAELFSVEQVERARRYHRPLYVALLVDVTLGLGVLSVLAFTRVGSWLYDAVPGAAFPALVVAVSAVVGLPLSFWRGHVRERRWGFSTQSARGWLLDRAKSFAVSVVLVSGALLGLAGLARWLPRTWPLVAAPAAAVLVLVVGFVAPVVLEPLFNRFAPLRDEELAGRLRALARRAGVPVRDVLVADASRRTRKVNAYVSGLGATRRVVLFDTLLDGRFSQAEILSVAAHELGHVGRRHIWKGLGWFALIVIPCTFLVARVTERWGGLPNPSAVLPGLALAFLLLMLTLPLSNVVSRRYEAEADWIALRTTENPAAFIGVQQAFVRSGLTDPTPPALYSFWFATHPSPLERIALAKAFSDRSREGS